MSTKRKPASGRSARCRVPAAAWSRRNRSSSAGTTSKATMRVPVTIPPVCAAMAPLDIAVTILDPALDPRAAMWGDASGDGWVDDAFEWLGTLSAAGVPVRAIADPAHDDGRGLLLVPRPELAPEP